MENRYADIIVDISHEKLDRSFQYLIPAELKDQIRPGIRVKIPFGNGNRTTNGYVIGVSDEASFDVTRMKEILTISDRGMTIESKLIALAAWIRENYGSTMIQALKTVLPIKDKVKQKEAREVVLNVSEEKVKELLAEADRKHYTAKARVLQVLLTEKKISSLQLQQRCRVPASLIRQFEEQGIVTITSHTILRSPIQETAVMTETLPLSAQQMQILAGIRQEWQQKEPRPSLIHGITGSGKTHIYISLIEDMMKKGKQSIVLIPEIALTYQTVMRFYQKFGNQIAVIHSRMSLGERYDSFEEARQGNVQVMIGPRSALFTPFPNLGLIIIDEEHEHTYKSEGTPRYHARETAIARGQIEDARVVLGSATPSVDAYYRCQTGEYVLFTLDERFGPGVLPDVYTVDLRQELKEGNHSILSRPLQEAIKERLARQEQTMLFLNRRGYAGFVSCRSCGHVVKCPHCDVSLSLHTSRTGVYSGDAQQQEKLVCHYCGYETPGVTRCPECQSPYIGGFRAGTQQIEEIVKKRFPQARVLRMDMDTTQQKDGHARILSAFAAHEADILVGTQMIVKGHDFPEVTLVGVLAADLSLNADDYRAGERTFQLLVQAVGRAGRGSKKGAAIIQTYHPEHYSIEAAQTQDYERFYEEEMGFRLLMDYPPASHMMAVLASGEDEAQLDMAMEFIKKYIEKINKEKKVRMIGPAVAAVAKVNDRYRRVLYIKHADYHVLTGIKDALERYIEINSGFRKLYIQFDFDM